MNRRRTGTKYERIAVRALYGAGYRILERNFRCRFGEIDIIASHRGYLVFVEVKYRRDGRAGFPEEAVDKRKQMRIGKTAVFYLYSHGYGEGTPCRFDVVSITGEQLKIQEDAFSYEGGYY